MASNLGNRQEEGPEDISILEDIEDEVMDPLADLAIELAMCMMSVEARQSGAGFCDWCSCTFKFHVPSGDGCELCQCHSDVAHISPPLPQVCLPITRRKRPLAAVEVDRPEYTRASHQRDKDAREVLRELSE